MIVIGIAGDKAVPVSWMAGASLMQAAFHPNATTGDPSGALNDAGQKAEAALQGVEVKLRLIHRCRSCVLMV